MSSLSAELHPAWIWLGGSFALAVLASNVRWLLRNPAPGLLADAVSQLRALPGSWALSQVLRIAYYIGMPFAALLLGQDAVTERYLGLQPFRVPGNGGTVEGAVVTDNWVDWAQDAGWAAAAAVGALLLLLFVWWTYRRALAAEDLREGMPFKRLSGWVHLREAAFHEAHWAFYRNAPLIALRDDPRGVYWGIWLGLGIVGLEASLNPAWRDGLAKPEDAPPELLRVTLALLSGLLFWKTQNLWLAIGLHFAVSWVMSAVASATTRAER